ncbi:MAG: hypothetical protein ABH814_00285 [bacterium]
MKLPINQELLVQLSSRFDTPKIPIIQLETNSPLLTKEFKKRVLPLDKKIRARFRVEYHTVTSAPTDEIIFKKTAEDTLEISGPNEVGKIKVALRMASFINLKSDNLLLLHATMVSTKEINILLVGPTGSGKTTIANFLKKRLNAEILANDFVLCKKTKDGLLASDLNFAQEIKHPNPIPVSCIFVCDPNPKPGSSDVWLPTKQEFARLTLNSLPNSLQRDLQQRVKAFWNRYDYSLIPVFAINTRKYSADVTFEHAKQIIDQLLEPAELKKQISVAIVGLGQVGTQITSQLIHKDYVKKLYLYNRNQEKQHGIALDFTQASRIRSPGNGQIIECRGFRQTLKANFLILCYREKTQQEAKNPLPALEERMQKAIPHINIIKRWAKEIRKAHYQGTVLIVTNPIEILTWFLYWHSNLDNSDKFDGKGLTTNQVYGVGLELDKARAELYVANTLHKKVEIAPFLQHGENLYLQIKGKNLFQSKHRLIAEATLKASSEIRKHGIRTVYGPAEAAISTLEGILELKTPPTYLSLIAGKSFVSGGPVCFNLSIPSAIKMESKELRKHAALWEKRFKQTVKVLEKL